MKTIVFSSTIHTMSDSRFADMISGLSASLPEFAPLFSLSLAELRQLSDAAALFRWSLEVPGLLKQKSSEVNFFRKQQRTVRRYEVMPPIPVLRLPEPPKVNKPVGDLNKLITTMVRRIKLSPNYTEEIGNRLGISDFGMITDI